MVCFPTESKPKPCIKRWWNLEISHMKKEKNCLNHCSYIHRACKDHLSHTELQELSDWYTKAIQAAKTQHCGNNIWRMWTSNTFGAQTNTSLQWLVMEAKSNSPPYQPWIPQVQSKEQRLMKKKTECSHKHFPPKPIPFPLPHQNCCDNH